MATQVKGARANKPNDSFGVMNDPNVYRNKYREDVYKDEEDEVEANAEQDGTSQEATQPEGFVETKQEESPEHDYKKRYDDLKKHYDNKLQEWKSEKEVIKTTAEQMNLDPSIKLPKSPDKMDGSNCLRIRTPIGIVTDAVRKNGHKRFINAKPLPPTQP